MNTCQRFLSNSLIGWEHWDDIILVQRRSQKITIFYGVKECWSKFIYGLETWFIITFRGFQNVLVFGEEFFVLVVVQPLSCVWLFDHVDYGGHGKTNCFSLCPQSFSASESFPMSWLFTSGGQNMDASVLLMNIEGWFPLGLIALISSLSKRLLNSVQFSSVTQSCLTLCDPMDMEHARPPCPSPTPGVYSESCPLSRWCHPAISSSDVLFSFCLQSFPASGSFQMSQFFASGGQNFGVSASASVLPKNIQDWFPIGMTGWISLQSKGLSRVFSNTTVQKHQFFGVQLSL